MPHSRPAAREIWTTRRLLAWMFDTFRAKGLDSPKLQAEILLAHVIGCERMRLYMEADRPASPLERQALRDLVARAMKHEPIQYLVGEWWFFGMPFYVNPRVLIPRPSSETIVDLVLRHARAEPGFGGKSGTGATLADLCTGSGCIAAAILKNLSEARGVAVDISGDALEVAAKNAHRHDLSARLDLLEGDLFEPLAGHPLGRNLHFVVANPPYISDEEWLSVPPNVKEHEPHIALRGGPDGLAVVRRIIADAPAHLRSGGWLMVETASSHADAALAMARGNALLRDASVERDSEGHPRVLVARRAP